MDSMPIYSVKLNKNYIYANYVREVKRSIGPIRYHSRRGYMVWHSKKRSKVVKKTSHDCVCMVRGQKQRFGWMWLLSSHVASCSANATVSADWYFFTAYMFVHWDCSYDLSWILPGISKEETNIHTSLK